MEQSEPQTPIPQPRNKSSFWRSTVEKHETKKALQQSVKEIKIGWQWWAKKMHSKGLWDLNEKEACPCEHPSECFLQRMARAKALEMSDKRRKQTRWQGSHLLSTLDPWLPPRLCIWGSDTHTCTYIHIHTYILVHIEASLLGLLLLWYVLLK